MRVQGREDAGKMTSFAPGVAGCWVLRGRRVAVRCVIGLREDGCACRQRLRLRDGSQTETDNQCGRSVRHAHTGATAAESPLQETDTHV